MSRAVKTDHEFDIERYAMLLSKAQGGRTQTEFAKDCGLSTAYICKQLNKRIDKAPIPSTLKKIAAVAANGVTYEDLLDVSGYDISKYSMTSGELSQADGRLKGFAFEKLAKATITSALTEYNFKWTIKGISRLNAGYDLDVEILDGDIEHWYIRFITSNEEEQKAYDDNRLNRLLKIYGYLSMMSAGRNFKYSLVTDSQSTFDLVVEKPPVSIAMYVSVILIDTTTLSIVKEEYIKTPVYNNDKEKGLIF